MFENIHLQHYLEQTRTAKMVLGLLAIGLLLSIFQLMETLINPSHETASVEAGQASVAPQVFVPSPLFGESPLGVLQQTRLKVTLKGTFATSHAGSGSAVIGSDSGDRIYVVGDTVQGAVIKDIQPDYIVLEYQGNNEILRLPEGQRLTSP